MMQTDTQKCNTEHLYLVISVVGIYFCFFIHERHLTVHKTKKEQVSLITLTMAVFHLSVSVSHDSVKLSQHEQYWGAD